MRSFSSGNLTGQDVPWYWTRGLHDARILCTEAKDLPYDFTERHPIRNCFKIHLYSSGAMFDTSIKCITLFNYKILLDDSDKGGYTDGGLDGCYWMQDILRLDRGKYLLEITALGEDDFRYVIQFESAQVDRL